MQYHQNLLEQFFKQNQTQLEKSYPGIKLSRLYAEYEANEFASDFFEKLKQGIPLEYISNNAFFYRSNFYVNEDVLIPRSESEILVEKVIQRVEKLDTPTVLEIGVGSFALGLSVLIDAKKKVEFIGTDICPRAIKVAEYNLFRLQNRVRKHKVSIIKTDRADGIEHTFDIIMTNPPYIKSNSQRGGVHDQTDEFEPHIALYQDDNIYEEWFKKLFRDCQSRLAVGGFFIMEGHEDSLEDLREIASDYFSNIELVKDYTDRFRFLTATK